VVKQYQVRDQVFRPNDEPMIRMEKERHLRGAVSMEQRRQRLGQYYALLWQDSSATAHGPVTVLFQYQQGTSASLVKHLTRSFPASQTNGRADFSIIGDNYFTNGKVLAWKATLRRGSRVLASRQSYLWQ
jgi:hypothetical protein